MSTSEAMEEKREPSMIYLMMRKSMEDKLYM